MKAKSKVRGNRIRCAGKYSCLDMFKTIVFASSLGESARSSSLVYYGNYIIIKKQDYFRAQ